MHFRRGTHAIDHDIFFMDIVSFPVALAILMTVPLTTAAHPACAKHDSLYLVVFRDDEAHCAVDERDHICSLRADVSVDRAIYRLQPLHARQVQGRAAQGESNVDATVAMIRTAGHVITVSNTTLAICFWGNFFSSVLLETIGIGSAITCICALTVNLTLLPAAILTFPNFFKNLQG